MMVSVEERGFDPADRVIVALDCGMERALELADVLSGHARWVKVGMQLFYEEGPRAVLAFSELGFKVFVDLKLHDIPHQIEGAARSVAMTGADMMTIHASGGEAMMAAAMEGVFRAAFETGREAPSVLAVTVLTSMDDAALSSIGIGCGAKEQVGRLARLALAAGVDGVVASPMESAMLSEILGPAKLVVTPGIRPAGADAGDQSRIATPASAFASGSTHVVIGRPITRADDPLAAFDSIIDEIRDAC